MTHKAISIVESKPWLFTPEFVDYIKSNTHVYDAFETEALGVAEAGFKHYSARTIIEVIRHHTAVKQVAGEWKLNNDNTPYLARVFSIAHHELGNLFEFRSSKADKSNQTRSLASA